MLFRRISYKIALQFMAFVFGLLLITGGIFIAADIANRDRALRMRMDRLIRPLLDSTEVFGTLPPLPPFQRERFRIVDAFGRVIYSGAFYHDIPFEPSDEVIQTNIGDETYDILTAAVTHRGQLVGYIQVADRAGPHDFRERLLLFFLISAAISGLTFGVGLFFARRSLRPADQMMRRLEQFTQDASHELRTPLTAVSTSLDLAVATKDYTSHIATAKKELRHVFTLVERLLELARLDSFHLQTEKIDASALIRDTLEKHREFAAEKHLHVESHIAGDVHIDADPALLKHVFINLFMNAVKFNRANGLIDVTLTQKFLSIRDTGRGISNDALPHIFDRFFQEDVARTRESEGLGLGLALTKRIVDLHGWTMSVESTEGEGTTFTVFLGS